MAGSGQEYSVHVFLAQTEEEGGTSRRQLFFSFFLTAPDYRQRKTAEQNGKRAGKRDLMDSRTHV